MPFLYNILILVSTHLILSFLYAAYRRPIEVFLAEELLSLRKKPYKTIQRAAGERLSRLQRQRNLLERVVRLTFPVSCDCVLLFYSAVQLVFWPISLLFSLRSYAGSRLEETTTMEICNDL